jgi:hypothetical protein
MMSVAYCTIAVASCCRVAAAAVAATGSSLLLLLLLLLQIPGFTELSIVSLLGAMMSVAYCTIAVAMCGTVQPPAGSVNYSTMAIERTSFERTMGIFNALTSILFAYGESYKPWLCVCGLMEPGGRNWFGCALVLAVAMSGTVPPPASSVSFEAMKLKKQL